MFAAATNAGRQYVFTLALNAYGRFYAVKIAESCTYLYLTWSHIFKSSNCEIDTCLVVSLHLLISDPGTGCFHKSKHLKRVHHVLQELRL